MSEQKEYKLQGFVARDEGGGDLCFGLLKPKRSGSLRPGFGMWVDYGAYMELPNNWFPKLTYKDEPVEVEIIIRRKEVKKCTTKK